MGKIFLQTASSTAPAHEPFRAGPAQRKDDVSLSHVHFCALPAFRLYRFSSLSLQRASGYPQMSGANEQLRLTEDWMLSQGDGASLGLSAVLCAGGDLIYLFSASPFVPGARRAQALPKAVQELLLFEPVVPLRYTHEGFQALQPSEWSDMSAEKDSYVGLNTLSSAQESVVSAEGDALDDFADSLSSGLGEDVPDLDCQSLRSSSSPVADLDGSDGESDPEDAHEPA